MKKLFLIRHAKSSWDEPNLSDYERPLNERGKKDAPMKSSILKEKNIFPDLIISSTAERAAETANIFASELSYTKTIHYDSRIYEATTQNLLEVVSEINDDHNLVFLFGHNPGLSNFANFISKTPVLNMPTACIVGLELSINKWKEVERHSGNVFMYEFPKKYK